MHRLAKDTELREYWQRYHLIGDAIKNNLPAAVNMDFAGCVRRAIDADPLPLPELPTANIRSGFGWHKPVTGFALAASIAGVVVLGLRLSETGDTSLASSQQAAVTPVTNRAEDPSSEALQSRLNTYLVNHNEYASMNSVQGVVPYVRIVGYEPGR